MNKLRTHTNAGPTFDKDKLSDQLTTLEALCADNAKAETAAHVGFIKNALQDGLPLRINDYQKMVRAMSNKRAANCTAVLLEGVDKDSEDHMFASLSELDTRGQADIVSWAKNKAIDLQTPELKENRSKIDQCYKTIMQIHPTILRIQDDVDASLRFGMTIAQNEDEYRSKWEQPDPNSRLSVLKDIAKEAFPDDNVDHLELGAVRVPDIRAACFGEASVDSILMNRRILLAEDFERVAFTFAHEYGHRRQYILSEKLKRGSLAEQSPEYFKARLITANMNGGYLESYRPYLAQPMERDADGLASLSCLTAGFTAVAFKRWRDKVECLSNADDEDAFRNSMRFLITGSTSNMDVEEIGMFL